LITWGSQKWNGAAPIFKDRGRIIIELIKLIELDESLKNKIIAENIRITEAIAWVIKYLIAVSVLWEFILEIRIGVILIKLISRPNQQVNQEYAEQAKIVPKNKEVR